MKILITGGAGFIGSQLGSHLSRLGPYEVSIMDNMSYGHLDNLVGNNYHKIWFNDIRSTALSKAVEGKEVVIHLAGISSLPECQSNPYEAYSCNVAGTASVLEACRLAGVKRIIFASTSAVYENSKSKKFKESEEVKPDLIYASTKKAAEDLCTSFSKNYGMEIIVCRFFNVYGAHQDIHRLSPPFTSYIAKQLITGKEITIYNNTDFKRDYVYVSDLITLLTLMIESKKIFYDADVFNVGSGKGYSAKEIFDKFLQISGKKVKAKYKDPTAYWSKYGTLYKSAYPLDSNRITQEVHKHSIASTDKVNKAFSWEPRIALEDGIEAVYQYALETIKKKD